VEELNQIIPWHAIEKRMSLLCPESHEIFRRIWPGEDGLQVKKEKRSMMEKLVIRKWKKTAWRGERHGGWRDQYYNFPLHGVQEVQHKVFD
jgi:hypothetical protein